MINAQILDDIISKACDKLPPVAKVAKDDLEKNLKAGLQAALGKLDVVTREEFDIQAKILDRCREKLERLELEIAKK